MTNTDQTNRVILVGILDPMRQRNKSVAVAERRTQLGGRLNTLSLQVDTPYGEPYRVTVSTGIQTEGVELLTDERIGQPLVVEGVLQTRLITDPRYAVKDTDLGRTARELHLRATVLREPREYEPVGSSVVWLDGVVLTKPRFGNHRAAAAVEMVRTVLRVRWARASGYPGSQASVTEEADINLSVPVAMENASYVVTPGNRVQIEGQLDCVLVPLRGPVVEARLKELGKEWDVAKSEATSTDTLRMGLRDYRRQRERLSQSAVLAVVPGVITPQPGAQLGDLAAARSADRERIAALRSAGGSGSTRERATSQLEAALTPAKISSESAPAPMERNESAPDFSDQAKAPGALRPRRKPTESAASTESGWVGEEE